MDIWLVGIGTGNPDHVTREGEQALRDAALILLPRKGTGKEDLAHLRLAILQRLGVADRVAAFDMPVRDESLPYQDRVAQWHDAIATRWQQTIDAADPKGPVALLVWGDPGLYDSTLRIADRLDPAPRVRVIPGITALQALTAAHAIPFNTVNGAVVVTTGRRLRDHGWPEGADTVAVMLDGACAFCDLDPTGLHIWWGAFLGMPEQVLDAGPLSEAADRIAATRKQARARHGWIMDTYLLRRRSEPTPTGYIVSQGWTASYDNPIAVRAGETLALSGREDLWDGHRWLWAMSGAGAEGWVPDSLLRGPADPVALWDYTAQELTCDAGQRLTGITEMNGWVFCKTQDGAEGWVPRRNLHPA